MLRYLIFAPTSFAFNLFVMVTCPLWAAWAAIFNLDRLPKPFHLVHTHDDTIYGTNYLRDVLGEPRPPTVMRRWRQAMWWLCRNPGYGFDAYVLGFPSDGAVISQSEGTLTDGLHNKMTSAKGRRYFSYRRDWLYRVGGKRYCKVWFGWHYMPQAGAHMLKFDINPFKGRS